MVLIGNDNDRNAGFVGGIEWRKDSDGAPI